MKTALDSASPSKARKWLQRLLPLVALGIFSAAIWALNRQLSNFEYADFRAYLDELSGRDLALTVVATVVGYVALVAYDGFAMRHIGRALALWRIALTAFIGFAFSLNIGQAVLSGGAVRMRFYTGWGLSAGEVSRIVAFNFLVGLFGQFLLGGLLFVIVDVAIPDTMPLPFSSVSWLGALLLACVVGFFGLVFFSKRSISVKGWHFSLPRPGIAIPAVMVSSLDWAICATVLYALLPSDAGIPYVSFVAIVMLAHVVAVLSMVPGGLGVFETVVISLLPESAPKEGVLSAMIAFRVIYYLVPFIFAVAAFIIYEAWVIRRKVFDWLRSFKP